MVTDKVRIALYYNAENFCPERIIHIYIKVKSLICAKDNAQYCIQNKLTKA